MMRDDERLLDVISTLINVFLVNERAFPPAEGRLPFNPVDFNTIRLVAEGPVRPSAVAAHLSVSATTMSSVVGRLERRGILARRSDPHDQRAKLLYLTTEGQAVCDAIRRQDLANMRVILDAVPAPDRPAFLGAMDRIADKLRRVEAKG